MPSHDSLLTQEEYALADKKCGLNKVVFAVMLKFFQAELYFPSSDKKPTNELIIALYKQLIDVNPPPAILQNYQWNNRSVERFRQEIGKYLGFRCFVTNDQANLTIWLNENLFKKGVKLKKAIIKSIDFFKENQIELPKLDKLDEYVRSAYATFDKLIFTTIYSQLTQETQAKLKQLVQPEDSETKIINDDEVKLNDLKKDPPNNSLKSILHEVKKLNFLDTLTLPESYLAQHNQQLLKKYYQRIVTSFPSEIQKLNKIARYSLIAVFCYEAKQLITDNFIEILLQRIKLLETKSEQHVGLKVIKRLVKVDGKMDILFKLANIAVESPQGIIEESVYPTVSQETLQHLVEELKHKGKWYGYQVKKKMRSLYSRYHRRLLLILINNINFQTHDPRFENLLQAINFIKQDPTDEEYNEAFDDIPQHHIMSSDWEALVFEIDEEGNKRKTINRFYYELAVFDTFRKNLNCKNIWAPGARKYRNPKRDLPPDWKQNKPRYFKLLGIAEEAKAFTQPLKSQLHESLAMLDANLPQNDKVTITRKNNASWIKITPAAAQPTPKHIDLLHREIEKRWQSLSLLDIVKETDLDVGFTDEILMQMDKHIMDKASFKKRWLLTIYGLGTNMGLKVSFAKVDFSQYQAFCALQIPK